MVLLLIGIFRRRRGEFVKFLQSIMGSRGITHCQNNVQHSSSASQDLWKANMEIGSNAFVMSSSMSSLVLYKGFTRRSMFCITIREVSSVRSLSM